MEKVRTFLVYLSLIQGVLSLSNSRQTIKLPAMDRSRLHGTVYNSVQSSFAESRAVNGDLKPCMEVMPYGSTTYSAAVYKSTRDRLSSVVADARVQLSIMSGLIDIGASGDVDWRTDSSSTEMEASISAQFITEEHYLDVDCKSISEHVVKRVLNGSEGDYFISSVQFGFKYDVRFKADYSSNSSKTDIKGYLSAKLSKLTAAFEASISGAGSMNEFEKNSDYRVRYQITGDAHLPAQTFDSIEQVLTFVKSANQQLMLRSKTDKGRPLVYILSPLQVLVDGSGIDPKLPNVTVVSEKDVKSALQTMDLAEIIYIEATGLESHAKSFHTCIPHELISEVYDFVRDFRMGYLEYKLNVSRALVNERVGATGAVALAIGNYTKNENSPNEFKSRLESKFGTLRHMLILMDRMHAVGVPCLPVTVTPTDFVVLYGRQKVYVLQYRSKLLKDQLENWNFVILETRYRCFDKETEKVRAPCFLIDCSFAKHFCSIDNNPTLRAVEGGNDFVVAGGDNYERNKSVSESLDRVDWDKLDENIFLVH